MSIDFVKEGKAAQGAISRFMSWWFDGLSACIVARISQHRQWKTLLFKTAKGMKVYSRNSEGVSQIGSVPNADFDTDRPVPNAAFLSDHLNHKNTVLRLGKDQVLQHKMQLPKGAIDVIESVVRNQLERIVPWPAPQMCFGYDVTHGDSGAEHVNVTAVATCRKILEEARAQAKQMNVEPVSIEFAKQAKSETGIEFIGTHRDGRNKTAGRIASVLAIAAIVSAAISTTGMVRLMMLASELGTQQEALSISRRSAAEVQSLREENTALVQQRRRIVEKRKAEPAVVVALEALSKALPDNSYLAKLEIRGRLVRLSGTSSDAASLINRLETSPHFSGVSFSAPTTRQKNNNAESFSISAKLEGEARLGNVQ